MLKSFLRLLFVICLFSCSLSSYGWANLASETLYLTWQQEPETTMTIQWVSELDQKETLLYYRLANEPANWTVVPAKWIRFPNTLIYAIHSIELTNLQPETTYRFKIESVEASEFQFCTPPAQLTKELSFVVGGDMYHVDTEEPFMAQICQQAAKTSPAFALLGGDLAYAVTRISIPLQKIERWIEWLKIWHANMITPQGNLIPMVPAIGNHDLIGQFDQTPAQAAVFRALFPTVSNQIYHTLDFGSYLSVFFMDSGHANPIGGQQTSWLAKALAERQAVRHRFAIYHVPAYPSIRPYYNKQSTLIRRYWVPLFEKGGIQVAFEHHDHAYKRSHPLLNNRIHPNGIIYLGDGAWGVDKPRTRAKRPYLAKLLSEHHFIKVTLSPNQQQFKAYNLQGQIIDEYVKPL